MAHSTAWWRFWNRDRIKKMSRRYRHYSLLFLEALEDRVLLDGSGPRILSISPTEVVNGVFDHLDVQFDRPINADTFTTADVTIRGPSGSIALTGVQQLTDDTYRILFPSLTIRGDYQATIGPDIADTSGNLMDQNQNGVNGETTADVFSTSLVYANANVILTSSTTIGENDTSDDGSDLLIDGTTVAIDGHHQFNSIQLIDGGVLTHSANTASQTHKLDLTVAEQVIVDGSSRIDVSGKGYLAGQTSGNSIAGAAAGSSGGSYGGLGGSFGGAAPAAYGDYADPEEPGSGPGTQPGWGAVPAGGGLVRLQAQTLQLDGGIRADGGPAAWVSGHGGGGGGGVYLDVQRLSGSGWISAAGGDAQADSDVGVLAAGGGGGGRVAVYYRDASGFNLANVSAPGGGGSYSGADGGAGTVFLLQGYPHTHVRWPVPTGVNGGYIPQIIGDHVLLQFNHPLDVASFDPTGFSVDGQMGHLTATGMTQVGDRLYRIDLSSAITEDGPYHFTLLPTALRDTEGCYLDQNVNGISGEQEDAYSWTYIVDTVPPRVTQHSPSGDVAGTVDHVDVWFSEAIDRTTLTSGQVAITRPDGQSLTVNSIQQVGLNRYRISFAPQTLVGQYHVRIGAGVTDLAGNPLDQTGADVGFNLAAVDLGLNGLTLSDNQFVAGEPLTVSWSGMNRTGAPLLGDWVDGVYLSADDQWDISDTLLATVPHTGGLTEGQTYSGSATVLIPGALPGNYHILVRSDVYHQEQGSTGQPINVIASPEVPLMVHPLSGDGTAANGTLTSSDPADYYALTVAAGQSVVLNLHGLIAGG